MHRLRIRTLAVAAALAVLLGAGLLDASRSTAAFTPTTAGCSTTRQAVAHHAGGADVPGATGAPVPCETRTGFGGAETRIAVTADGTVVYEPATMAPGLGGTGFVPGAPGAPGPCEPRTGLGGAEPRIAVPADGTVVYEPATMAPGLGGTGFVPGAPGPKLSTSLSPGGLAVTSDQGAHWQFVKPGGATW